MRASHPLAPNSPAGKEAARRDGRLLFKFAMEVFGELAMLWSVVFKGSRSERF